MSRVVFLLGAAVPVAAQQSVVVGTPLVFDRVTVVDVEHGKLLSGQRVVITGNRIQAVGKVSAVRIPKGAQIIDAQGKYLIPGLWDMHAHTEFLGKERVLQDSLYRVNYPLYIAHGVTGIREMAQQFAGGAEFFRSWQRRVMEGEYVGPRAVGPSADLSYIASQSKIRTPEAIARVIDSLKAAGDAFAKFHGNPNNPEFFFAILRQAKRVGLPVAGHVPKTVTNVEASDSGLRSVEHIDESRECIVNVAGASWDSVVGADSAAMEASCAPVVQAFLRNGTWIVPTAVLHYAGLNQPLSAIAWSVGRMHRLGMRRFLAGADCAKETFEFLGMGPRCHRGIALLLEIVLLAESGLSSLEALQSAILNPAIFLEATDSIGSVAPGKLADLVLLDADPLTNIRNVMRIRAVVANGRYFDRPALDALDPEGAELAKAYLGIMAAGRLRRGFLGAVTKDVSEADAKAVNLPEPRGVAVAQVGTYSAAEAVGIKQGDIILTADGKPVESLLHWRRQAELWQFGKTVTLEVLSADGLRRTVDATLGEGGFIPRGRR